MERKLRDLTLTLSNDIVLIDLVKSSDRMNKRGAKLKCKKREKKRLKENIRDQLKKRSV